MPIARPLTIKALTTALKGKNRTAFMRSRGVREPDLPRWSATVSRIIRKNPISREWEDRVRMQLLGLPSISRKGRTTIHLSPDVAASFRDARDSTGVSNDEMMLILLGILPESDNA